jgi:DNA-binding MurR/RpiR family transcriptional regulator
MLPSLRPSDGRVANVLLAHGERVGFLSVSEVAALAGTAESTVVRACQRLGYKGFHDLKRRIVGPAAGSTDLVYEQAPDAAGADLLERVVAASTAVLNDAALTVDRTAFARAAELLAAADQVLFVGVGPSSPLAQDAAYRFRMLGVAVDAPVDALTQHLCARLLSARSACVIVSHTGATRESLLCAEAARDTGAATIAVTSVGRSPLTAAADLSLVSGGRGATARVEATASRFAHLAVLDALYLAVAQRTAERALVALDSSNVVAADHQF